MLLVVGSKSFTIDSYSDSVNQVSVDLRGDCKNIKLALLDATNIQIVDNAGSDVAYFTNLTFKSITAYADDRVTAVMTFPEVSTVDKRMSSMEYLISVIEQYIADLEDIIAELMFGTEDEEDAAEDEETDDEDNSSDSESTDEPSEEEGV